MDTVTITKTVIAPCRSPSIEEAVRELGQIPVTEACVSGLCDLCLFQMDLCNVIGKQSDDSPPSRGSGNQ